MANFLTRLAERSMGATPVVQPLTPSMFAPEPAGHPAIPGLETDAPVPPGEASRSPSVPETLGDRAAPARPDDNGDTAPARHYETVSPEGPPPDARPAEVTPGRVTNRHEDPSNAARTTPERIRDGTGAEPGTPRAAEPAPTRHDEPSDAPRRVAPEDPRPPGPRQAESTPQDLTTSRLAGASPEQRQGPDRRPSQAATGVTPDSSAPEGDPPLRETPATPGRPRKMPETRSNPGPIVEAGPSGRDDDTPESPSTLDEPRPREKHRQDPSRSTTVRPLAPSEVRSEALPDAEPERDGASPARSQRGLAESGPGDPSQEEDGSDRPAGSLVEPGRRVTVPPSPYPQDSPNPARPVAVRVARPPSEGHPAQGSQESRQAAPEPPEPTVRVSIGRIEVRAIASPPPAAPPAPARSGPAVSLDDYLNQLNGGRR
jgi:hypothetical protein